MSRPPAEKLAAWVQNDTEVGDPEFHIKEVTEHFGIRLRVDPSLKKAGQLRLERDDVVIAVQPATYGRRRFTAAHELGHYLLASEAGIRLVDQTQDRRIEAYCNVFASHLLLPRPWVRKQMDGVTPSLRAAMTLSENAGTSLLAAVVALNDCCHWDRLLVRWVKGSGSNWLARTVVGSCRPDLVEASDGLEQRLRHLGSQPTLVTLPLCLNGESIDVEGEAVRFGSSLFTLIPSR